MSGTWTSPQNRLYATQNTDSTPLATFNSNIGSGISNYFQGYAVSTDKIFLGGFFTTYNGVSAPYFAVLNRTSGALISSGVGSGFSQSVRFIHVQSDNKIICAGTFTTYNGVSAPGIIRLNTDYTIDATFNPGSGFSGVVEGGCFDDTHVYIVGNFTSYNGVTRNRFIKIRKSNGADDTPSGLGTGFSLTTFSAHLDGDNIFIGGNNFTTYNGTACPQSIIKVNKNTFLQDATFATNAGTGATARVFYNIGGDGTHIYISGSFSSFNGQSRNQLAKLTYDGVLQPALGFSPSGGNILYTSLFFNKTRMLIAGGFTNVNPRFVVLDIASNTTLNGYNVVFPSGLATTCFEF